MFGKLRDKLKSFLGHSEKSGKKPKKAKEKLSEKPKKHAGKTKKEISKIPTEEELKVHADQIQKEVPQKFHLGSLKTEPDIDKIKAQEKNTEETPKSSFLSKLTKKLSTSTLRQSDLNEILEPLELILLENNVALEVVDKIKADLEKDLVGIEVKKQNIENIIKSSLKESISSVLIEPPDILEAIKKKSKLEPYVIVFFGINGSGKTTSLAKLANYLRKNKISCVLGAADTFRAASIEQLQKHADALNIKLIKQQYGSDPTAVAFDAKKYAEKNKLQCVLIDTAGRMYTKENLIKEMEKLIRIIKPDLKIFVAESITGNDAVAQAKTFNEALNLDGIILTKADVDEKGGTALSVSYITKKPIYFLGTGQTYSDFQPFKKEKILNSLGLD